MVGGTGTFVDFLFLYTLTELFHLHYLISTAVAFAIATGVNYLLCIAWVFERGRHSALTEVLLVFMVSGVGLLLNEIIVFLLVEFMLLWYMSAQFVAVGAIFFWNYSTRKYYVFLR